MIVAEPALWDNLIIFFPKAKKFRNNKSSFPLFDSLEEFYDGHLAEGTYNFTSTQNTARRFNNAGGLISDLEETLPYAVENEGEEVQANEYDEDRNNESIADSEAREANNEVELVSVASNAQRRMQERHIGTSRNREEREQKRQRRPGANIEGMMERYLQVRSKQAEDEAALRAKEQQVAQGSDYSIKRCISVMSSMEVSREEKTKTYSVFKSQDNREFFLCAYEDDPEAAMMWLRSEMA